MALFNLFERETLYLPGCFTSSSLKSSINNYERVLKKLGISFRTFNDSFCCGAVLEESGYEKEARKLARDNLKLLEEKGVKHIITSCANCYRFLTNNYRDMMPNWNIKTEFILEPVLQALKSDKFKIGDFFNEPIFYYDSCYLARYSSFYETPREILKLLGFNVLELVENKSETRCCGSCGMLPVTNLELSNKIAREFIKDLKKAKIKKIITADSQAYKHLMDNLKKEDEVQVVEFSEVLCESLGLKKEVLEMKEQKDEIN